MAVRVVRTVVFESLGEMVAQAEKPECGRMGRSSRERGSEGGWSGTATFEEAAVLARKGWDKPRKQVADLSTQIMGEGLDSGWIGQGDMWSHGVEGDDVDIDRFVMGDPENMIQWSTVGENQRAVRILVSTDYNGSIGAGTVLRFGAVVTALVEALAASNVSVELWTAIVSRRGQEQHETYTRVKSFEEPLDIDAFMYCAANPSYVRRIWFGLTETEPEHIRRKFGFAYGYGGAGDVAEYEKVIGETHLYVPHVQRNHPAVADPVGWVREQVKRLKGE